MRKTSKPSTTLKQDLENKLLLIAGVKVMIEKNFEKGTEVSSTECSQYHGISSISSEDTF